MHVKCYPMNLKERAHLKRLGARYWPGFETELKTLWLIWLKRGDRERWWNFGFHTIWGTSELAELLLSSQYGFCCMQLVFFSGSQIHAVAMFILLITGTHDVPNWRYRKIWFLARVHEKRCIIIWMLMSVDAVTVGCYRRIQWTDGKTALCCVWSSGLRDAATTPVFIQMSCSHVWGAWAAGRGYGFDSYVPCLVHRFTGHCTLCVTMQLLYSVTCRRTCCEDIVL